MSELSAKELVERLREVDPYGTPGSAEYLAQEAADHIETQDKRIADLEEALAVIEATAERERIDASAGQHAVMMFSFIAHTARALAGSKP